jgi:hypothetical protein
MMALRAHARGGPEQLVYEQAPAPSAGPGEVLIAVHAAAITFAELTLDLEWTTPGTVRTARRSSCPMRYRASSPTSALASPA